MRKFTFFTLLFFIFPMVPLLAQTSYNDDFESGLSDDWEENNNFSLSEEDGRLKIGVHTTEEWQSFRVRPDETIDVSSHPYVNVKVKGSKPFEMQLYLQSGGNKALREARVTKSDEFVNYCFDFTGDVGWVDLTEIKYIVFGFNGTAVNFDATVWLDDLKVGTDALKIANLSGTTAKELYEGTKNNKILITDIENATHLSVSGADNLIENVSVSGIYDKTATVVFDCKENVSGSETVQITAHGAKDYEDNSISFTLDVIANNPPTIDPITEQNFQVGEMQSIVLTNIDDADPPVDQQLVFTVTSDNQTVLPDEDFEIKHTHGSPYATLYFTAKTAGQGVTVTVNLQDNGTENNSTTQTFTANAYDNFNDFPSVGQLDDQKIFAEDGTQTIDLSGIADGESGSQMITISASSSDQTVLPNENISVTYAGGSTAELSVTPIDNTTYGTTTVTVTVGDDGTGTDDGPKETQMQFVLDITYPLQTGYVVDLSDVEGDYGSLWTLHDGQGGKYTISTVDSTDFYAMKVECNDKFYWDGYNLNFNPGLDLSEHPYMSMEVYSIGKDTRHWIWFYDETGMRNNNVNYDEGEWATDGQWTKLFFDFSGELDLLNTDAGKNINANSISRILLNMHDAESSWPTPSNYNGTFYLRNIRVGSEAEIPDFTPTATINLVDDIVLLQDAGTQQITLTGITDGDKGENTPTVNAVSDNTAFVPHPTVSAVNADGTATLEFTPTNSVDEATITLTVSATGSNDSTITFSVETFSTDPSTAEQISVDLTQKFQTIRGFGTFYNKMSLVDYYTDEMGGTAVRVGLISNQVEPVNDNNDPNVLNRDALNYDVFDWDYMKALKEKGVETFVLTSWSPPAWMKGNLAKEWYTGGVPGWENTDNKLLLRYYDEFAESMVAIYRLFEEEAGIQLDGIGIQNEPAFDEPYPSAILSPEKFAEAIAVVGKRFEKEGIETLLFMPEQVFSQNNYSMAQYMAAVRAHPEANKYTDVIATHGYAKDGIQPGAPDYSEWESMYDNAQTGDYPKELWMTETYRAYEDFSDAIGIAGAIYGALEYGNINLWTQWSFEGQYIVQGQPSQMLYAMRNFAKFIRPGAVRVLSEDAHEDIMPTCFVDEKNGRFAAVIINKGSENVAVNLTGDNLPASFDVYQTTALKKTEYIETNDGHALLPAQSITTLVAEGNQAPTIAEIEDRWVKKNSSPQTIVYQNVSEGINEDGTQSLDIDIQSSDPSIVAVENYFGTRIDNPTGLIFTPQTDQTGSAEITITLTDNGSGWGYNSTTEKFTVHVYDKYNNQPVVDAIPDQFILEDAAEQTITVTGLGDGDDNSQELTVVATSSNTAIVPDPTFSSIDYSSGELKFTPVEDAFGEVTITLTVTDDGGTASNNGNQSVETQFKIQVAPVNDAPLIDQVADKTLIEPEGEQTVDLSGIDDGDSFGDKQKITLTSESDLVSLIPNPEITYNNGSFATLNFTPVDTETGSANITVTVMDDGGIANGGTDMSTMTFLIDVLPDNIAQLSEMNAAIYPNPVVDFMHIGLSKKMYIQDIVVTDISGKTAIQKNMNTKLQTVEINVQHLDKGIYLLSISDGSTVYVAPFVKE